MENNGDILMHTPANNMEDENNEDSNSQLQKCDVDIKILFEKKNNSETENNSLKVRAPKDKFRRRKFSH